MNIRQLELQLAKMAGVSPGEVDQRLRPLRHVLIPAGPRGRHAPDIDEPPASFAILAMVSRRAVDSMAVAARAGKLRPALTDAVCGYPTLAAFIAGMLAEPGFPELRSITIAEDGGLAWVSFKSTDVIWAEDYVRAQLEAEPEAYHATGAGFFGRRFVIGAGALAQIGFALQQRKVSGWADPSRPIQEQIIERMAQVA